MREEGTLYAISITICADLYRLSETVAQQGIFTKVLFAIMKVTDTGSDPALMPVALLTVC